jgi:hypothetical protein
MIPALRRGYSCNHYQRMIWKNTESRLVRDVMPDASEEEIQEATGHWFGFLNTLYRIVLEREQVVRDSHPSDVDDNVGK